ncbi:MAG: hypothetical protein ACRCW4_06980, partial [Candidatus Neomicrothrix subdominans]
MPRPSPTPAEMPGRLVIFGAAQGMGRWLAEQIFAEASLQLVLVDVSHHIFEHSDDQRPNPPLRLKVAYEGGIPVFTGADGGAAPSPLDPPGSGRLALCLAVPADAVDTIASVVLPLLAPGSIVFDVTS